MSALYRQQQTLLHKQLQVLARIEAGMRWSQARLPAALNADDQAGIIERFTQCCRKLGLIPPPSDAVAS